MKKRAVISASILIAAAVLSGCSESKPTAPNMSAAINNSSDNFESSETDKSEPVKPSDTADDTSTQDSQDVQNTQDTQSSSTNNSEITPEDEVIFAGSVAIVGTRAMALYGANPNNFKTYAEVLNKYKEALPDINVYNVVLPVACEFYAPPEVAAKCASQRYHINIVNENLADIRVVDAYSALEEHADEDIYLKTDHHWSQLGGYYAAEAFAKAAGVPFLPLSDYEKHVNTGFCGTMLGYSDNHEIIKNNPEDFVYYVPQTVSFTTTYYNYVIDSWDITGAYDPVKGSFFLNYGDNSGDNYCTFMGGDAKIVRVETNTNNGRRLLIIKDSYGNAIVPNLFGSFEEIYVTDLRFFSHNMIDYIRDHNITDLLIANNTTVAGNPTMINYLDTIRTQADRGF